VLICTIDSTEFILCNEIVLLVHKDMRSDTKQLDTKYALLHTHAQVHTR